MKSLLFRILIIFGLTQSALAQKTLYDLHGGGSLDNFIMNAVGDSLLLQFDETSTTGKQQRNLWLSEKGKSKSSIEEEIFSVVESDGQLYYYFVEGRSKSPELKVLLVDADQKKETSSVLRFDGTFLGRTVGKILTLYFVSADGQTLSIKKVQGLTVVEQKVFKLPINILEHINNKGIDFFMNGGAFNAFKGMANVKLYPSDTITHMTIEHVDGTQIIKFDLRTSEVTTTSIPHTIKDDFNSFYLDGKLFRIINAKQKFTLNIYDVASGALNASSEILATAPDFKTYFRFGRKNIISHKASFHQMTGDAKVAFPVIAVERHGDRYIVQWGAYYNQNPGGAGVTGLLTNLIFNAFVSSHEAPGVLRYFYYEWDGGNGFTTRDYPPIDAFAREKLDQYEIDHQARVGEKRYIRFKNGVAALYYQRAESHLSVVYFE